MLPRGIRNNNPGNINFAHQKGAVLEDGPNARFAKWETPEEGLEALRDQLIRNYVVYRLHTVKETISRWAPPVENNTKAYIDGVAKSVNLGADTVITTLTPTITVGLMNGIIQYENGMNPYGNLVNTIAEGGDYSKAKA